MFTQGNLNLRPFIIWATNKYIDSRRMPVLCAGGGCHSSWINPYMAKPYLFQSSIRNVCVCIHICSHVNMGVGGYTDADRHMFSCVCLHVHSYAYVNVGVGGYTNADMYVPSYVCVYMHVHLLICVLVTTQIQVSVSSWEGQRLISGIFVSHSPFHFPAQALLAHLELTCSPGLAGQWVSEICLSVFPHGDKDLRHSTCVYGESELRSWRLHGKPSTNWIICLTSLSSCLNLDPGFILSSRSWSPCICGKSQMAVVQTWH